MITALIVAAAGIAALLAGLYVGARRQRSLLGRAGDTADQLLREARAEAQRLIDRSEGEARALAENYREREEDTLQHRRIEIGATHDRLDQREGTL